ncbi:MAG: MoaD/ThiS family protein [Rhizobacter sp.]
MSLRIRYFASVREALGEGETVPHVAGETVAMLRQRLRASSVLHAVALDDDKALRCALNQTLCSMDAPLPDGAEVAFFPPVTGG